MRAVRVATCFAIVLAVFGCGGGHRPVRQRVLLPPNLNLAPHRNIGLFEFSVENAKGNLHEFATHRFEEYVLAAQSGIEMREFTAADSSRVFAAAADSNGCPVAFFGHLKISNVKPHGGLTASLSPVVRATVTVELSVWLVNTRTGGIMWRKSSASTEEVGGVSISGGLASFSARDPNDAYGRLINQLVYDVTYDVRSTWVDQ
ncbi:MAG TPA: hypothetical protein VMR92_05870 [Gemmatimonadales bacterium]|jgi:hypothetical protein|nr:hypothetical protein [Gemmatimonadales bacterium]